MKEGQPSAVQQNLSSGKDTKMSNKFRNTMLTVLVGLLVSLTLANDAVKLDGSGFVRQARVASQPSWDEMRLTEGDEGFTAQREYVLAVQREPSRHQRAQRFSLAPRLGERLER